MATPSNVPTHDSRGHAFLPGNLRPKHEVEEQIQALRGYKHVEHDENYWRKGKRRRGKR